MKKLIAISVTAALGFSVLAGCSSMPEVPSVSSSAFSFSFGSSASSSAEEASSASETTAPEPETPSFSISDPGDLKTEVANSTDNSLTLTMTNDTEDEVLYYLNELVIGTDRYNLLEETSVKVTVNGSEMPTVDLTPGQSAIVEVQTPEGTDLSSITFYYDEKALVTTKGATGGEYQKPYDFKDFALTITRK